jgi:membrane protein
MSHDERDEAPGITQTVIHRYMEEGVGTQAAGIGLFALMALPAALLALTSIYGLVADPGDVAAHVGWLARFLPPQVVEFLQGLMDHVIAASPGALGVTAVASVALALLAAQRAMAATMGALDRIAHLEERRSFWRRQLAALALALAGIALLAGSAYALLAQPFRPVWPGALVAGYLYLALLYRYAPSRREMSWRGALSGALVGLALALLASVGLSWWVIHASDYEALYGAAGSVVIVLLWSYLVALGVLVGGIVGAERRRQELAWEEAWSAP